MSSASAGLRPELPYQGFTPGPTGEFPSPDPSFVEFKEILKLYWFAEWATLEYHASLTCSSAVASPSDSVLNKLSVALRTQRCFSQF